jgi:enoyl reductase-like protein
MFLTRQAAATRAVSAAAGAAKGAEAWSVASVAVAGLESARSRLGLPLADLDRLEVQASNLVADGAEADFKAVRETRAEVEALAAGETSVIDSLLGRLAG